MGKRGRLESTRGDPPTLYLTVLTLEDSSAVELVELFIDKTLQKQINGNILFTKTSSPHKNIYTKNWGGGIHVLQTFIINAYFKTIHIIIYL